MPDLGNILNSSTLTLSQCPNLESVSDPSVPSTSCWSPDSVKTLVIGDPWFCNLEQLALKGEDAFDVTNGMGVKVFRRSRGGLDRNKKPSNGKCLNDYVKAWVEKKVESGTPESKCFLPFLVRAPKLVLCFCPSDGFIHDFQAECLVCNQFINPTDEVLCSVRGCRGVYHRTCAKKELGFSTSKKFKCPQHACFICKQRLHWRCVRCKIASHDKCAAWPDKVTHLRNQPGLAVCWRHPPDWRLEKQRAVPANDIEDVFCRLPLPYIEEEFKIDMAWKGVMENKMEPSPYVHIKRNLYLVKKKRDNVADGIGCANCSSTCSEDCVCRVQCISCSKACRCSEVCTNRPFRKDKKIKVVKTELCGWGVVAAESINKGDFVIEYIGEVISDALCEQRLWDMKYKGVQNFYMCEIRKDFTIDATFKGNSSRFLNHSCDPNCMLEKWQVEGETRVGVFAARSIKVGEPLTYDYRFVQFGPEVRCQCGASKCHGYLGTKRKICRVDYCWGLKRKRSLATRIAVVTV